MYLLRIETYFGAKRTLLESEDEALKRLRLWKKHPTFIRGSVEAVATITVPYAIATEARA